MYISDVFFFMIQRLPRSTRTSTPVHLTTLFRSRWRGGKEHFMRFRGGDAEVPLAVQGDASDRSGTQITFMPSTKIFTMTDFDFATLEHRLRELADRKSTRLNSSPYCVSRMPFSACRKNKNNNIKSTISPIN